MQADHSAATAAAHAGQDAPPRVPIWPWLKVRRFEYASTDEHLATLELLVELRAGVRAPAVPELRVRRGGTTTAYQPAHAATHRRAIPRRRRAAPPSLIWTARFEVPLVVIEYPRAVFELATAERSPFELGIPYPRLVTGPTREAIALLLAQLGAHEEPRYRRRHATALASAVAFAGGLSSAVAATADSPGTTTPTTPSIPTVVSTVSSSTTTTPTDTTTTATVTTPGTTPASTTTTAATPTDTSTTTTSTPAPTTATTTTTTTPTTTTQTTPPAPAATTAPATTPPATSTTTTSAPAPVAKTPTKKKLTARTVCEQPAGGRLRARTATTTVTITTGETPAQIAYARRHLKELAAKQAASCKPAAKHHKRHAHRTLTAAAALQQGATHADQGVGAGAVKVNPKAPANGNLTPVNTSTNPWSGSPVAFPFNGAELEFYASLVKNINQPPKYLLPIYRAAAKHFKLPWQLLAAINREETDYGKDLAVSPAGAEGFMQFMPGTWAQYGMALDSHNRPVSGPADPWDPRDAIFSAARYLRASGATRNVPKAVFSYNHATWYVIQVLSIAQQINQHGLKRNSSAHRKIAVMNTEARLLNGMPYKWGGGHANWLLTIGYDCSGFVSRVLHSAGWLKEPVTTQSLMGQPGIKLGPGRQVTIYDRTDGLGLTSDHVIIRLGHHDWWESGGSALNGGGARVHQINWKAVTPSYLATFNLILHPEHL